MMRVLDLFSGIGGFSLGLERTGGFKTVAFCEIDLYCQRVLAKHWPGVKIYGDIRELTAERLRADGIVPDVLCGGFPCQDISLAGSGAGIAGERSGLWSEYSRLIGDLRPRYAIVENVAALLARGLDKVLGDLAALGFDAEWHCIPASAAGAPHRRDRIWIVAYSNGRRCQGLRLAQHREQQGASRDQPNGLGSPGRRNGSDVENADGGGQPRCRRDNEAWEADAIGRSSEDVADADEHARYERRPNNAAQGQAWRQSDRSGGGGNVADADQPRLAIWKGIRSNNGEERQTAIGDGWWATEPAICRVAHGVPSRVDRLRTLGNAVVPQVVELIGRAILESGR